MTRETGLVEGDRIRIEDRFGSEDHTLEVFRDCLGYFETDQHRTAGNFTPVFELYGFGAGSESGYLSNYGEYVKNPVALWMQLPRNN